MSVGKVISKQNFRSFLWHAGFLAFAQNFMDIDTVIPAMLVEAGGTPLHIGLMAAILTGGSSFTQIIFAPLVSNDRFKKKYLLLGINSRILSLIIISAILWRTASDGQSNILVFLFIAITIFAVGGAFANVSYTDILGKTVNQESRKKFFSSKQLLTSIVVLFSAFLASRVLNMEAYPQNYAMMFVIGFIALTIASLGFWRLKENIPSKLRITGIRHYFEVMKAELKSNGRIKYFLGFINTQGIAISFLPFVILYAKELYLTGSADTGKFLIFKVIGGVLISMVILMFSKFTRYRLLLYLNVILTISIPLILLLIVNNPPFWLLFLLGGLVFSIYSITMNGVLLEISGDDNRTIYTGLAGAGNIVPALFPLVGGWIIKTFGYTEFFIVYMGIVLLAFYFIYKLKCLK
ncbi:MAG: MFS transporter [Bacteroidales bacterium]|nr:MFS transporter [Bacteroidales bacterium]